MREKRKGHAKAPSIGFGKGKTKGLIRGMKIVMIYKEADIEKIKDDEIGIISSNIGKKKKVEIAKKALRLNKKLNFDAKTFLDKIEREKAEKEKAKISEKKIETKKEEQEKKREEEKIEEKKAEEKSVTAEEKKPEESEKLEEKEKIMMREERRIEHGLVKPRKQIIKRVALKK